MKTRTEFAKYWNNEKDGLGDPDSPLWEAEHDLKEKCEYFCDFPVLFNHGDADKKSSFWDWCNDNLLGYVRCFSSGDNVEWWGFTNQSDIILFRLRW